MEANAPISKKTKKWKNNSSFSLDATLGYFCGAIFSNAIFLERLRHMFQEIMDCIQHVVEIQLWFPSKWNFFHSYTCDKSDCLNIKTMGCRQEVTSSMWETYSSPHTIVIYVGKYSFQPYGPINFQM